MTNNNLIRIGLLGTGKMGQNHLRNLSMMKKVDLSFIYDIDVETCKKLSEQYCVRMSENLEQDLQKVDGVIIATPTFTHADYINRVSQYVKNIFIEKPLADTLDSSRKIVSLAEKLGLNMQIGFIERYNSAITALKRVVRNSNQIINIDFSRTNKVSSRITDVDVIIDLMIHDIDLALHINGKPIKVDSHGFIKNGMAEYARTIITHENGSFSNIVASRITEKRIRHISATCDDMYVDCNLLSKEVHVSKQSIEQYLDDVSISSKSETVDIRPQEGLLLELMDFIKICQGEIIDVPNQHDGLLAMEVAHEIQQQILEGASK